MLTWSGATPTHLLQWFLCVNQHGAPSNVPKDY